MASFPVKQVLLLSLLHPSCPERMSLCDDTFEETSSADSGCEKQLNPAYLNNILLQEHNIVHLGDHSKQK